MPAPAAATSAVTPESESDFVSTCSTTTAERPATKRRWSACAAGRLTTSTKSSAARNAAGGRSVTASAKRTISRVVEPRMAKKAAFLPRMSSSGCASAKAESTVRCAPFRAASRQRESGAGTRKVEDPCARGELLGARDLEALLEAALEPLAPVVGVVVLALAAEEPRDHRVVGGRELDDERCAETPQPLDHLGDRHVAADREVVDEGEAEREVRRAARAQRAPLEPAPAEAGRRIGEVHRQRKDRARALGLQGLVEPVDDDLVRVDGDDVLRRLGGDARVAALVAAEVPDDARPLGRDRLGDEARLPLGVLVAVGRRRRVTRPRRLAAAPREAADELLELLHVREDQLLAEAGRLELALEIGVALLVAPLEPRVQKHVREGAATDPVAEGQEVPNLE